MSLLTRRRALMAASGGESGLPSEYQQVEWVGYSSTTYIYMPSVMTADYPTRFEVGYYRTGNGKYNCYAFCVGVNNANPVFAFNPYNTLTLRNGSTSYEFNSAQIINKYAVVDITVNSNGSDCKVTCEGEEYTGTVEQAPTGWAGKGFLLWYHTNSSAMRGRIYYAKVWRQGSLIIDLIPCYRKADSVIGFYDLVGRTFYTNAGTGTFTKGADVN